MSLSKAVDTSVKVGSRPTYATVRQRDLILDNAVRIALLLLVTVLAILYLIPIYWLFVTSIKLPTTLYSPLPDFFPKEISFLSWRRVLMHPLVPRWFLNSLLVSGSVTVGSLTFSALTGYVFAKLRFPGRNLIFWAVLLTMMLPGQATIVPMYAMMVRLGWLDTYWPLIMPSLAGAFGVFLMKQFMQTIPSSLIDAARMDACSEFKIFWRVVLPLAKSGLAVLTIFVFVGQWNDFLWPLLILRQQNMQTLQVGLASLRFATFMDPQLLMASAAFAAVPTIIVFIFFQRYFLEGLTIGALKG